MVVESSMTDGRRHSVDIPISKALLTLRRVRSLRDPTTTSLSRFYASTDNLNCEESKWNGGTSFPFPNDFRGGGLDTNNSSASKNMNSYAATAREDCVSDSGLDSGFEKSNGKEIPVRMRANEVKDADSWKEPNRGSPQVERGADQALPKRRLKLKISGFDPASVASDVMGCVRSPCLSWSDSQHEKLSHSCYHENEGVDSDDSYHGCGIKCCWARAPIFRESSFHSDLEDRPWLSGEVVGKAPTGQSLELNNIYDETAGSSRTISQKFRPRFFCDLVGQSVVARSLLSAISKRTIHSLYLFHGPHGTGKTSASRMFAAALNCLSFEERKPCGLCQECKRFFSGRSRDVREVDPVRINGIGRFRTLMKNAVTPPVSSSYKVFIFDECHLMHGETWGMILSSLEGVPPHVVFVMITPHLDKLPRSALSRSQRYHFSRIKDADIANRLGKICVAEGLEFDPVALDFIAAESNGSLRDAEMMIEQLSLLGKKITISLAHELIGFVSDDELLDLLDLALSSDTKSTVRRARELMRSRIDPLQLISQLANLIMDILAEKCQGGAFEVKQFSRRSTSEADLDKLSHALKVLSETEKQLRSSKNQTTWLTVALLQLSSVEASPLNSNDSGVCLGIAGQKDDGDLQANLSASRGLELLVNSASNDTGKSNKVGIHDNYKDSLESIWQEATEICQSNSLKKFLRKYGRLSSICANHGKAIVELEFCHSDHVAKAEKSWKAIASSLKSILNRNVEIRINRVPLAPLPKFSKERKSFCLFSCSQRPQSTPGSSQLYYSEMASDRPIIRDKTTETCSSHHKSLTSQTRYHKSEAVTTIRDGEGNAFSTGATSPNGLTVEDMTNDHGSRLYNLRGVGIDSRGQILSSQERENKPNCCFSKSTRLHKTCSSNTSEIVLLENQTSKRLALPNNGIHSSGYPYRQKHGSKVHCWDAPWKVIENITWKDV